MQDTLGSARSGGLSVSALTAQWRTQSTALPLPDKYGQVLGALLDRLEAGALFSEESCSFSQSGLLDNLQQWLDKARTQIT